MILAGCTILISACTTNDDKSEYTRYAKIDFKNTYQKYEVKDGFVNYQIIYKHADQSVDTATYEVYFNDYGAEEYILEKSKNGQTEFYKKDSTQYQRKEKEAWFEQSKSREFNYLFEKIITNETSKHYQDFMVGLPLNSRYLGKRCNQFQKGRLKNSYAANAIYYQGIPMSYAYQDPIVQNKLQAIRVDTNVHFPLVIKVK